MGPGLRRARFCGNPSARRQPAHLLAALSFIFSQPARGHQGRPASPPLASSQDSIHGGIFLPGAPRRKTPSSEQRHEMKATHGPRR
jgi:hypothetical protein